jgi:hypothetical protein
MVGRSATETSADERLVQRTLARLGEHDRTVGMAMRKVGAAVIDDYFGGDVELARSNKPTKPKSFARLVKLAAKETEWTVADFRRAVTAERVARSLPRAIADALLPSYLVRLSSIDDPAVRVEVAKKIASGEVRGRAAEELVAKKSGGNPQGGRKRVAGPVRVIGDVERVMAAAEGFLAAGVALAMAAALLMEASDPLVAAASVDSNAFPQEENTIAPARRPSTTRFEDLWPRDWREYPGPPTGPRIILELPSGRRIVEGDDP